jgi:hypothetical protein
MSLSTAYSEFVMAMERVEQRLRAATRALDDARIPYAVVGGNAVAAWIAQVDPEATRTTKDVDLLVRRADLDRVTTALAGLGFKREDLRSLVLFVDPAAPSRRSGVHVVFAAEKVRPSYLHPAPDVSESVRPAGSFSVLDLAALLRMKLTSLRDIDRVHVADLISIGLVTDAVRQGLPPDLLERLESIERGMEPE